MKEKRVRIRKVAQGLFREPIAAKTAAWFAELDRFSGETLLKGDRKQPKAPRRRIFSLRYLLYINA
jgi:hypothetical protein